MINQVSNKRSTGSKYEDIAAAYLRDKGYTILTQNFRDRYGEIDIVALNAEFLIFVEVKYRNTPNAGDPLEAITYTKQNRIRKMAVKYMSKYGYDPDKTKVRFDCIGILGNVIRHIENAF